jgi:trigger factor
LNFQVLDSAGSKVAQVIDNELVMSSIAWDIELVGTRLIIREGHGRVLLDIQFTPPSSLRVRRARFLYNGIELLVTEEWAAVLNNSMLLSGNVCVGGRAGLAIGDDPEPVSAAIRMGGIRRHGWDRAEAIRWIKERVGSAVEAPLEEIYGFTDSQG